MNSISKMEKKIFMARVADQTKKSNGSAFEKGHQIIFFRNGDGFSL